MKTATGITVIEHGQLVDGTGSAPIRNAALVVEDGRIRYVGSASAMPLVDRDATRIDAKVRTRFCRASSKPIFMRPTSTLRHWKIWISSIRWNTCRCWPAAMPGWLCSAATRRPAAAAVCSTSMCG